jgi:predicted O-methyltransferase YrrM
MDQFLDRSAVLLRRLLPKKVWQPIRAYMTGIVTPFRFSSVTGHWKSSISMSSVARDGNPVPWYTYPAIDFLAARDFHDRNVLEFGGGQSTVWWGARARSVLTIEEDAEWVSRINSHVGGNVRLHHVPRDIEARSLRQITALIAAHPVQKFDIVVVDGHLRRWLASMAFDYLAPDGAIIVDNAERHGFYEQIRHRNCRRIDFLGFAPGVSRRHCTSIVFVEDCFLLRPDIPVAFLDPRHIDTSA